MSSCHCDLCKKPDDDCDCSMFTAKEVKAATDAYRLIRRNFTMTPQDSVWWHGVFRALDKFFLDEKTPPASAPTTCAGDTGTDTVQ